MNLPLREVEYASAHTYDVPMIMSLALVCIKRNFLASLIFTVTTFEQLLFMNPFLVPSEMTPMERPVVVLYMELVAEFLQQGAFSRNKGNLT